MAVLSETYILEAIPIEGLFSLVISVSERGKYVLVPLRTDSQVQYLADKFPSILIRERVKRLAQEFCVPSGSSGPSRDGSIFCHAKRPYYAV